jgi:hypothetical protein
VISGSARSEIMDAEPDAENGVRLPPAACFIYGNTT